MPRSFICVDISHNQGRDTVGSLVWFEAGRPRKSEYRKFKIQGAGQQDDYAAIQEVLTRYFTRRKEEQLPVIYIISIMTVALLFEIIPFVEEFLRGLRANHGKLVPTKAWTGDDENPE